MSETFYGGSVTSESGTRSFSISEKQQHENFPPSLSQNEDEEGSVVVPAPVEATVPQEESGEAARTGWETKLATR